MKEERMAFFVHYDEKKNWLKLCRVKQSFDERFQQWEDAEEPQCSFAVVPATGNGEGEANYIHFDFIRQMHYLAECGYVFLGIR